MIIKCKHCGHENETESLYYIKCKQCKHEQRIKMEELYPKNKGGVNI